MPTDTGRRALLQGQSGQKRITKQADRSQGPRCHPSREKAEEGRGCKWSEEKKGEQEEEKEEKTCLNIYSLILSKYKIKT